MASEEDKPIQEILSLSILLADRVIKSAQDAEAFKPENTEIARQVAHLSQLLRAAARLSAVYDRPLRRVAADVTKALKRAFSLAQKCRHRKTNVLHQVLSITTTADFKKVSAVIDSSLADIKWVLSIFNRESSDYETVTLPPIASTDPILAWVWPHIAAVHAGRAESALELATLAKDSERNRKIIVEEFGIPPLLKMLKDNGNVGVAKALLNLADDVNHVSLIASGGGVQVIVRALYDSPMSVQVVLVKLVSRMCELDGSVKEEFGRENVTRVLVTLLGMDVDLDEFVEANVRKTASSLHSVVQISKEMARKGVGSYGSGNSLDGSKHREREREMESPELKLDVKMSSAIALSRLASGSLLNSKKITDTKALLVLSKIIEKDEGLLKKNCLMVVMELAAVAEVNAELKRNAFKPNTTAAKAVFDQLLRVINEDTSPEFMTPAIKAVGCLSSMFPAKEKRIVQSLVAKIGHMNHDVASETAKALSKFVCDDNYNRKEHCQTIIEFNGVMKLVNLLRSNERVGGGSFSRLDELVLLCYLAINVGNSKAFEHGRALSVLERAARHVVSQRPELRELFAKGIHQLTIYQVGVHGHRQV